MTALTYMEPGDLPIIPVFLPGAVREITDTLAIRTYEPEAFPRFEYMYDHLRQLPKSIDPCAIKTTTPAFSSEKHKLDVLFAGKTEKYAIRSLSKKKGKKRKYKTEGKDDEISESTKPTWPIVPLMYFMDEDEDIGNANIKVTEIMDQLKKFSEIQPVIVYNSKCQVPTDIFFDKAYRPARVRVPFIKAKVRLTLSSVLEMKIYDYLRMVLKEMDPNVVNNRSLIWEVKTLLKHEDPLFRQTQSAKEVHNSDIIPSEIVDEFQSRNDILSFGTIYGTFCIFLDGLSSRKIEEICDRLQTLNANFYKQNRPKFYKGTFIFDSFFGQGSHIYRWEDNEEQDNRQPGAGVAIASNIRSRGQEGPPTATLGAVMEHFDLNRDLYALASWHLFPYANLNVLADVNGERRIIGESLLCFPPENMGLFPDMSILKLHSDVKNLCDKWFYDEKKKPKKTRIGSRELSEVGIVHKRGAATDITDGIIISTQLFTKAEQGKFREGFVVKGTPEKFALPGDSGSVVFTHSAHHTHLEAIGMVSHGNLKIEDDSLLSDLGIEQSDLHKINFASKIESGIHEARKSKNLYLQFVEVPSSPTDSDSDHE